MQRYNALINAKEIDRDALMPVIDSIHVTPFTKPSRVADRPSAD
jgi:hypothetical protein